MLMALYDPLQLLSYVLEAPPSLSSLTRRGSGSGYVSKTLLAPRKHSKSSHVQPHTFLVVDTQSPHGEKTKSSHLTAGYTLGVVLGTLGGIVLLLWLVYICFRRPRIDTTQSTSGGSIIMTPPTNRNSPLIPPGPFIAERDDPIDHNNRDFYIRGPVVAERPSPPPEPLDRNYPRGPMGGPVIAGRY